MTSGNFWDLSAWSLLILLAALLVSVLVANLLKRSIQFLKKSLIPSSVLGGLILLAIATIYKLITKISFFETPLFGENGISILEVITYHCLGLGFIAMTMSSTARKFDKKRATEIFDTGITTVSTYLIQGILGLGITMIFALFIEDLIPAAGILLPFGYGQGTGQALNYGNIYEVDHGFIGGRSFGLTIAALGFLSASIGGVIYLNILKKKGLIKIADEETAKCIDITSIQEPDEMPMNSSLDKMTVQIAAIICIYVMSFAVMYGLGELVPSLRAILFGFNFLIGVLIGMIIKNILSLLRKKKIMKKQYINSFLMNRIGGFLFDVMIVAGIAAIQIDLIAQYWHVLLVLGITGAFLTFFYVRFICVRLHKNYAYEQFFAMYGMLTGTASTGIILLREIDPEFKTPAADNLVYQNFPAIVFGLPMMLIAAYAPDSPTTTYITFGIIIAFFIVMNIILFRKYIFWSKNKRDPS